MLENDIDLFVHPNVGVPQWKIGIDREPTVNGRAAARSLKARGRVVRNDPQSHY